MTVQFSSLSIASLLLLYLRSYLRSGLFFLQTTSNYTGRIVTCFLGCMSVNNILKHFTHVALCEHLSNIKAMYS